jgi:hypothetical protein
MAAFGKRFLNSTSAVLLSTLWDYGRSIATDDLQRRGCGRFRNLMHGIAATAAKWKQKYRIEYLMTGDLMSRKIRWSEMQGVVNSYTNMDMLAFRNSDVISNLQPMLIKRHVCRMP